MDDLLLVGGGLANCLLAWRLAEMQPDLSWRIIESGLSLGGNHTWSFHESDLTAAARHWIAPLVAHRWEGHEVAFPAYHRRLNGVYASLTSEQLHARMMERFGDRIELNRAVETISADSATAGDTRWPARCVIDGRGPVESTHVRLAYQKFVGLEVETATPHGRRLPMLMDATVKQKDGFRFLYLLPFSKTRLLIEDTRYSDAPQLDTPSIRRDIREYAAAQGWRIVSVEREEAGVLPITLDGNIDAFWRETIRQGACLGLRGGLCHPTTGYSLPDAVRVAERIVAEAMLTTPDVRKIVREYARAQWRQQRFYRLLNRMLFLAATPESRYRVLERFYRLPEALIARFYAGETSFGDQCRILSGRPPVSLRAAWRSFPPSAAWKSAA